MATPGVVRSRLLRSVCVDVWPCTPGTAPGTARATINTSAEKAPAVHIILQQPKAAVRAQWGRCMPAAQLNEDAARTQAGLGLLQQLAGGALHVEEALYKGLSYSRGGSVDKQHE